MNKERPKLEQIPHLSEVLKYYWVRYDSFKTMQDILYHKWEDTQMKYQIVFLESLRTLVKASKHITISELL